MAVSYTHLKVMLYNDTLSALDVGMVISTRGVEHHLEICMGDQVLYQYRNQEFQKNLQMQGKIWADVFLPKETGQEPVCLIYEGKKNGQLYIQAPIIGSFAAVIRNHVKEAFFSVLIMLGMLGPVSYTHLDVYKRQIQRSAGAVASADLLPSGVTDDVLLSW